MDEMELARKWLNANVPHDPVAYGDWQESLAALLRSVRGEWLPIETAPRDTKVLVTRCPYNGKPPINLAHFSSARLREHCKPWRLSAHRTLRYHPTHWMPLPPVHKS